MLSAVICSSYDVHQHLSESLILISHSLSVFFNQSKLLSLFPLQKSAGEERLLPTTFRAVFWGRQLLIKLFLLQAGFTLEQLTLDNLPTCLQTERFCFLASHQQEEEDSLAHAKELS